MTHPVAIKEKQEPLLNVLAQSEQTRSGFRLAFPKALEARYRRDIAAERVQELRFIALWGVACYFCLGILLNLTVIQAPEWRDVMIQLLGSSLIVLAIIHRWLRTSATVAMRENALLLCCLINSLAAILMVLAKPAPITLRDFLLAIPPASFILVFVRLRFQEAVIFFLINTGVYALAVSQRQEISHNDALFLIGFMMVLHLPALLGSHAFERALRKIYLHRLLDRLRSENLVVQNASLTDLSYTDSLTGIANRRRLDEALSALVTAPESVRALLLVDIDRFKAFNDSYGHLAGDACICHVAQCLSSHLRSVDLIARFGGEEFAVLLAETKIDAAVLTAERLREAVQNLHFSVQGQQVSVTISIGIAMLHGLDTPDSFVGAADTALYAAKHAGRNRVQTALPGPDSWKRLTI